MGAFERVGLALLLGAGLAACDADAGKTECSGDLCDVNPGWITGEIPGSFQAGAGDAAAGNVATEPDAGGESGRTVSGLARGYTGGGGGPDRSAGHSGSLAERVVIATDVLSDPNAGRTCDGCDDECVRAIELCNEDWDYCACADLCYYGCLKELGGCGHDAEDLEWYIEEAEWEIEESGIACP